MRPVVKGAAPSKYSKYQDAIDDLTDRLGIYCSYCERRVVAALEVEHLSPKSLGGALVDWENFLLSCKTCNIAKSTKRRTKRTSLWPHIDNTFLALTYRVGGFVSPSAKLMAPVAKLAEALVDLVKLDRHGATVKKQPTKRDKRWSQREETWELATQAKTIYRGADPLKAQEALDTLIKTALGYGFFSVWMTVFADTPHVCSALVTAFKGTDPACFKNGVAVARSKGRV